MASEDQLLAAAAAAKPFATAGEEVVGVLVADPFDHGLVFLCALGPAAERHTVEVRAAYHDACHLGHAQRITAAPRALLRAIPGLELVELRDAGVCCGSAGVYNLLQPDAARELGSRKADSVSASDASLLISAWWSR